MAKKVPMRLKYLRVNPKSVTKKAVPCVDELNALLACWRLSGVDAKGCAELVQVLSRCSSKAVPNDVRCSGCNSV